MTTGFTGHEILVFGAIDNSQQPESRGQDQSGGAYYDVVVVVEGTPYPVVVRRKSDVAGVWINTSSVTVRLGAELLRHRLDAPDRSDRGACGAGAQRYRLCRISR